MDLSRGGSKRHLGVRLRLVTSQGPPYPSRSPRAHPSGWTSLLSSSSLSRASAPWRSPTPCCCCAASELLGRVTRHRRVSVDGSSVWKAVAVARRSGVQKPKTCAGTVSFSWDLWADSRAHALSAPDRRVRRFGSSLRASAGASFCSLLTTRVATASTRARSGDARDVGAAGSKRRRRDANFSTAAPTARRRAGER